MNYIEQALTANSGFAKLLFLLLQERAFSITSFRPAECTQFQIPQLTQSHRTSGCEKTSF